MKPDVHIYTLWKLEWLELPEGTPAFPEFYDTSKLWPEPSLKRLNAALAKAET